MNREKKKFYAAQQVKKQAKFAVAKRLEDDQHKIRYKLRQNCGTMKSLTDEQTRLKRELVVLQDLIRMIRD